MRKVLLFTSLLNIPQLAYAQDAALYDTPPPADAAFVRFIGFEDPEIEWEGLNFPNGSGDYGYYFVVRASQVGQEIGSFITVLPNQNIIEPARDSSKVTIGFINLSDKPATLKTVDGSIDIISETPTGSMGWRQVNPISVSVQVFLGEVATNSTLDIQLVRQYHRTFIYNSDGSLLDVEEAYIPGIVE